jgi:hypothetical protein
MINGAPVLKVNFELVPVLQGVAIVSPPSHALSWAVPQLQVERGTTFTFASGATFLVVAGTAFALQSTVATLAVATTFA